MERHFIVWSTFGMMVVGLVLIFCLIIWFRDYVERTRANNPTKAALVSFLFYLSWVLVLIGVRIYVPSGQSMLGIDNLLREIAMVGIIILGLFTTLFGLSYVFRVKFHKRFI